METKSFDGGLSENLYFDNNYEQDFINIKGYKQWTQYREDWEKYCKLEKESEFPPHLEFDPICSGIPIGNPPHFGFARKR